MKSVKVHSGSWLCRLWLNDKGAVRCVPVLARVCRCEEKNASTVQAHTRGRAMALPPIDATFSWSDKSPPAAVDPSVEAELEALHRELGVQRGAALTGTGTKPELSVPAPPLQMAVADTINVHDAGSTPSLTPASILADDRFEHRTCGMHPSLVAALRLGHHESTAEELLSQVPAELGTRAAILISTAPIGPPKAVASRCSPSELELVVWLLLDPLDVDSKQTTFAPHGSPAFEVLYKWAPPLG